MFEFSPKITKKFLLDKKPAEAYFEFYLGVPVKKGLFNSPSCLRKDNHPTCSFYKNSKGDLTYKDFAGISGDFITIVMEIYQVSYYKALNIIANDFGYIKLDNYQVNVPKLEYTGNILKETNKAKIQVEIKDFSEKELNWWSSFGISLVTLKKFKVVSVKHVFLNDCYFSSSTESSPIYGYYMGKNSEDEELWRLYMPTKKTYRFMSNVGGTALQGSKQIPKDGDYIIITKSMKDVMSLYEFGVTSIAPISENCFLTEAQYNKIKTHFKNIFLLYDLDLPGIKAAKKVRKNFPDVQILLIPRKYKCKDFSDFVKKYNTLKVFDLIDIAKEFYLNK